MLKNKKLMLAVALPILILGVGYKMTQPKPVNKDKIKGTIYVMPAPFLLNLADGKFAKITVALELALGQSDGASRDRRRLERRKRRRHAAGGTARA